ncbi:MAG TPA: GtrA family protein, partial [Acidobacteriaceae bacterium]
IRVAPRHYLCATAAAIEVTLLHNFVWHLRLTWRDRADRSQLFAQLLRFHLSNGAISMTGNLLLMRIFTQQLRLPLLMSNVISIACCSILNYFASDRWAFARKELKSAEIAKCAGCYEINAPGTGKMWWTR